MRVELFRFAGYDAGQTDFDHVIQRADAPVEGLNQALKHIGDGIAGVTDLRASIIVVGHADHQTLQNLTCDQRWESEVKAARNRATSAWESVQSVVGTYAAEGGWTGGDWWEDSDRVTWALVFAGAGMNLASAALNRRVDILVSIFDL